MFFRSNKGIFALGGILYGIIEMLWRRKTHWSMVLTGGLCFLSVIKAYGKIKLKHMWQRCIVGSVIITALEFCSGCIFNRLLHLKIWDYSHNKLNFKGQVCAFYSFMWGLLCIPISLIAKLTNKN